LGQWAVSRKKSEQWRVKSEQKKQNKMRGAVSVEQWAWSSEQKKQKKIIPFGSIASRGAVDSEQWKLQEVMHSGHIGISQIGKLFWFCTFLDRQQASYKLRGWSSVLNSQKPISLGYLLRVRLGNPCFLPVSGLSLSFSGKIPIPTCRMHTAETINVGLVLLI
jgi:hypothetical protein